MPPFDYAIFLLGCIGGVLPEVLRIIKDRFSKEPQSFYKDARYWFALVLMIGLGGFVAYIFQSKDVKDALIYGFVAPELLTKIAPIFIQDKTPKADTVSPSLPDRAPETAHTYISMADMVPETVGAPVSLAKKAPKRIVKNFTFKSWWQY